MQKDSGSLITKISIEKWSKVGSTSLMLHTKFIKACDGHLMRHKESLDCEITWTIVLSVMMLLKKGRKFALVMQRSIMPEPFTQLKVGVFGFAPVSGSAGSMYSWRSWLFWFRVVSFHASWRQLKSPINIPLFIECSLQKATQNVSDFNSRSNEAWSSGGM